MSTEVECKLHFLQRGGIRTTQQCERPRVTEGYERCPHFIGEPRQDIPDAEDVVETCRRAKEAGKLPPIDKRL